MNYIVKIDGSESLPSFM